MAWMVIVVEVVVVVNEGGGRAAVKSGLVAERTSGQARMVCPSTGDASTCGWGLMRLPTLMRTSRVWGC